MPEGPLGGKKAIFIHSIVAGGNVFPSEIRIFAEDIKKFKIRKSKAVRA
jgi:hypothetical protein